MQLLKALKFPHIIKFNDVFASTVMPCLYLVLDFADGGNLANLIEKTHPLDETLILVLFYQVCLAIQYLHDNNIIHRDIKRENILLMSDGRAMLSDFGISKFIEFTSQTQFSTLGSLVCIPPEMITQGQSGWLGKPADIYQLGVLLFSMYNNFHPFEGMTAKEIINKIESDDPEFEGDRIHPKI